jgi:hypothetical protein
MGFLHTQQNLKSLHLQNRRPFVIDDADPMLEAGQATDICHIAPADDPYTVIAGVFYLCKIFADTLAGFAIQGKGPLYVIHREAGTQGDTFRRDDIAQFLALGTLNLDIPFGNQALEMPVHCPNRHSQLRGKSGLVDIRIAFNIFEKG